VTARGALLLVDDDAAFRRVYGGVLRGAGLLVHEAADRPSAKEALQAHGCPVVLLDLMLPPDGTIEGGQRLLQELLSARPATRVVVLTGAGDASLAVDAVRRGAWDFLQKPVDPDVLLVIVERAFARAALDAELAATRRTLEEAAPADALLGEAQSFLAARTLAERVAPSDLPVLVTGENGTGKELFARFVHERSRRRGRPFVPVNCGALPEALAESLLFGHVKGAFTSAHRDHDGVFAQADGGTLFLDEVGDLPLPLQVKLLRALESGEVLPLGGERARRVDVRIVSATNRPLPALLHEGKFREDLYWRLHGVQLPLPPLRERLADLPLLGQHFLGRARALSPATPRKHLTDGALEAMARHPWPGNLRELRHELQRATVLTGDRAAIEAEDLSFCAEPPPARPPQGGSTLAEKLEALERSELQRALAQHGGNRTHAAAALGLSRQGLQKKLERLGIA
jgi:two-component system response regulator AtoC